MGVRVGQFVMWCKNYRHYHCHRGHRRHYRRNDIIIIIIISNSRSISCSGGSSGGGSGSSNFVDVVIVIIVAYLLGCSTSRQHTIHAEDGSNILRSAILR